ncbi:MAG: TonB-dependent receptor [Candidatus Cloacimonetes bacterium]|nr:TonB-dependent receptor [Candidatus Cloacimonadota bacterium]MBT4334133.1 TonB-dependent receptor [Candidatus Cloacimonadota bacterium]MBT4575873.1 TonB-dependent receptor [Candidatus Cloacimonadota bacterium]MBT5420215.1 TonB-dependent receptor [Candidatus Cloacimonadota bacterium]
MLKKIIISLMLAFLFTTILSAGTTGKLAGKVTDEKGNPIPFANITIMDGETLVSGMMTKENGSYFIINITPGVYDVFCMRGGFRTQKRSGVKISLDLTQIENFKMPQQAIEIEGFDVVESKVEMIQPTKTQSGKTISAADIEDISVTQIEDVIAMQAGVTLNNGEIHVRGGRSNEMAYTVDGMSVSDPVDGGAALTIDTDAIADMDVMTGGLTAEYGNAQSGMVNIVTKSGSRDYSGKFEAISDHLIDSPDNSNRDVIKFAIGGPVLSPLVSSLRDKFTFYLNAVGSWHDTRYKDYLTLNPYEDLDGLVSSWSDYVQYDPYEGREDIIGFNTGNRNYNDYNANLKMKYKFNERQNITFAVRGDKYDRLPFAHNWRYALEHYAKTAGEQRQYIATYDQTIGSQINIKVKASMYEKSVSQSPRDINREDWFALDSGSDFNLYGDNQLGTTEGIFYLTEEDNNIVSDVEDYTWEFETLTGLPMGIPFVEPGTVYNTYIDDGNKMLQLKTDVEYQANETHGLKTGFEVIKHTIEKDQWRNPWELSVSRYTDYLNECEPEATILEGDSIPGTGTFALSDTYFYSRDDLLAATIASSGLTDGYKAEPWQGGLYLQDAMVWEGLIINAGVRCDVWHLGDDYEIKTASYNGSYLESIDPNNSMNEETYKIADSTGTLIIPPQDTHPIEYAKYMSAVDYHGRISDRFSQPQFMISPRLGVSHPISEKSVLHFVYNYQRQLPQMQYIFTTGRPIDVVTNPGSNVIVGNPELKDQTTITYEAGLQYQLHDDYVMDITGYFKNVYNYVSTIEVEDPEDPTIKWNEYVSEDYGSVRGIDLNISKFLSNFFSGSAAYSLTWANGNHSETTTDNDESLREFPLEWDTRHNFNFNITFKVGAGEEFYIPFTEAVLPLQDFSINFLYNLASGSPYTPHSLINGEDTPDLNVNSAFAPHTANANLKFTKNFSFGKNMKIRCYANISNLFNKDNFNSVYPITGNPYDEGVDLELAGGYYDQNLGSIYSEFDRDPSKVAAGRTYSFGLTYIW